MLDKILSIDPGIHTGYCFLDGSDLPILGEFSTTSGKAIENYLSAMRVKFKKLLNIYSPRYVVIEGCSYWEQSAKSRTSVSRGNLFKLAYLVGVYAAECCADNTGFEIVDPRNWKGSLSKEGTAYRVKTILGLDINESEHVIDALALGLSTDKDVWKLKKSVKWKY